MAAASLLREVDVQRVGIIIAGMHRSGTSALTRMLGSLGCRLPNTPLEPNEYNALGYWESHEVAEINDAILASAGSSWDDWEPFHPDWYASPVADDFRQRAQAALKGEFGDSRLFVLKDPRVCRLLPFWIDALGEVDAKAVVASTIRNPLEVAASLQHRDAIHPSIGQLLWLRHVLDAEAASREIPRAFVRYEDLLSDWGNTAERLGHEFGVSWPKRSASTEIEIEDYLTPSQRHHARDDDAVMDNSAVSAWVESSFEVFDRWTRGQERESDGPELDAIRSAFDEAGTAFVRPIVAGMRAAQENRALQTEVRNLNEAVTGREQHIDSLNQAVADRDADISSLHRVVADKDGQLGDLNEAVADRDVKIDAMHHQILDRDGQIGALHGQMESLDQAVADRNQQIESMNQAVADRDVKIDAMHHQILDRDGQIEALHGEVSEREKRIESMGQAATERDVKIDAMHHQILDRDGQIEALHGEVSEREKRIESMGQAATERDVKIDAMHHQILDRDGQIEALHGEVSEREKRIESMGQAATERDVKIDAMHHQILDRDGQIESLRREVHDREQAVSDRDKRIGDILTSASWRLTRPLRALKPMLACIVLAPFRLVGGIAVGVLRLAWWLVPLGRDRKERCKQWLLRFPFLQRFDRTPESAPVSNYVSCGRLDLASRNHEAHKNGDAIPILFDPTYYLASNKDVREAGIDPLAHYLEYGAREYRLPLDIEPEDIDPVVNDLHRLDLDAVESFAFDAAFYRTLYPDLADLTDAQLAEHYERHGKEESRSGSPGEFAREICDNPREIPLDFNPSEYIDLYPDLKWLSEQSPLEALRHYMCHGRSEPRLHTLRGEGAAGGASQEPAVPAPRVSGARPLCVLAHIYYPELWDELSGYLGNLPQETYDLYVNLVDTAFSQSLITQIRDTFPAARIHISENIGRDIGGFFGLLRNMRMRDYQLFCLVHTKQSPHMAKGEVQLWRRKLLIPLLGSPERAVENIEAMLADAEIGMIGAYECRYTELNDNPEKYFELLDRLEVGQAAREVEFLSGTMMFLRREILQRLFEVAGDIPFENGEGKSVAFHRDGQWAHAVERALGAVLRDMGYRFHWVE